MPLVAGYYRPDNLDEALTLLAQSSRVALAGGTMVNADAEPPAVEVVDLQALGLSGVRLDGAMLTLGATTTLDAVTDHPDVPEWLKAIAAAESPSTLRTLATVGGTVAARWSESMLLAAMLACDASVELAGADDRTLVELLADGVPPGCLITALTLDVSGTAGRAVTARTPADVPIVGAIARRSGAHTTLALTGVADTPVVVDAADPAAGLAPPGDFRGSSAYRLTLARVLSARALAAAGADEPAADAGAGEREGGR